MYLPIPRQWSSIWVYVVINIKSHKQLEKSKSENVSVGFLSIVRNIFIQVRNILPSII